MISHLFVIYLHVVLIECMYVFHQGHSISQKPHLISVNSIRHNRLLTASTTINGHVVLRNHHRSNCVCFLFFFIISNIFFLFDLFSSS
jgi:hypothetical protein